jgi:hypothetical protein
MLQTSKMMYYLLCAIYTYKVCKMQDRNHASQEMFHSDDVSSIQRRRRSKLNSKDWHEERENVQLTPTSRIMTSESREDVSSTFVPRLFFLPNPSPLFPPPPPPSPPPPIPFPPPGGPYKEELERLANPQENEARGYELWLITFLANEAMNTSLELTEIALARGGRREQRIWRRREDLRLLEKARRGRVGTAMADSMVLGKKEGKRKSSY